MTNELRKDLAVIVGIIVATYFLVWGKVCKGVSDNHAAGVALRARMVAAMGEDHSPKLEELPAPGTVKAQDCAAATKAGKAVLDKWEATLGVVTACKTTDLPALLATRTKQLTDHKAMADALGLTRPPPAILPADPTALYCPEPGGRPGPAPARGPRGVRRRGQAPTGRADGNARNVQGHPPAGVCRHTRRALHRVQEHGRRPGRHRVPHPHGNQC